MIKTSHAYTHLNIKLCNNKVYKWLINYLYYYKNNTYIYINPCNTEMITTCYFLFYFL